MHIFYVTFLEVGRPRAKRFAAQIPRERCTMSLESQPALILSQMEAGGAELERPVQTFERAVMQAKHSIGEIEQLANTKHARDHSHLHPPTPSFPNCYPPAAPLRP